MLKYLSNNHNDIKIDIINYLQQNQPLSEDLHSINLRIKEDFDNLLSYFNIYIDKSHN